MVLVLSDFMFTFQGPQVFVFISLEHEELQFGSGLFDVE
jgi:hypothetical protein